MTETTGSALYSCLRGLGAAIAGALLACSIGGYWDARLAGAGADGGGATASGGLALACCGLAAPLAAVVGVVAGSLRAIFTRGAAWSPPAFLRWVGAREGAERAAWLATPPLLAVTVLVALVVLARLATLLLGAELRGAAAFALLPVAVLPLSLGLLGLFRVVSLELAARLERARVDPRLSLLATVSGFAVALTLLIAGGETGGGGAAWRSLGVLRRQELDLRAPGLLLISLVGGLLLPSPRRARGVALTAVACVLPLWLTRQAAVGATLDETQALAIERQAPLGRIALGLLRRLSDRDHDGVSALFAGGDCNDHDARLSPRAIDVPGNGLDEDCQGGDAKPPEIQPPSSANLAAARGALARLPGDLNVLFVTIDTLRADLGYAGNPRPVSPHLDALAAESVVFERAYSLASYTGKSMGPLMIGKYSSEVEGGFSHFNKYSKRETFVQERLQAAGVRTLSIQGYWYFFKDAGFERGFDVIDSSAAPKQAAIEGDQSSNSDEQSDAAIKLLAAPELADHRFFMWMHFVDPHAEYAAHPEHDFGSKPRDRYDGEVAFVDEHLGRVLAALERASFGARTAVVVTSDHGEAFSEHGMIRHGFELWEELVHVPLIVKVPGVAPRRVHARRSAIDVVPTLLDLFKLPFAARGPTDFLSGESLLLDLLRAASEADPDRAVLVDMARGPYNAEREAFIAADQKLTVSEGRVLGLYDLASDPAEKVDLSAQKARVQPLREQLVAFTSRLRRVPMPQP